MALLEVNDMITGYEESEIIHGVSLEVENEEIVCIVGPNGAGKSTVLKCITGLIHPWEGSIVFDGEDISGLKPDVKLEKGIAYVPQGRSVFKDMTVMENIKMGAYTNYDQAYIDRKLEDVFDLFGELQDHLPKKARNLSGGQQQMVELSRALMMEPDMLLVDEPSLGLAPQLVESVLDNISRLRQGGVTVVIVEQNVKGALEISDRGYVLADGQNVFSGDVDEIRDNEEIGRLYLGG